MWKRVSVAISSIELLVEVILVRDGGSGSRSLLETLFEPLSVVRIGGRLAFGVRLGLLVLSCLC